ncbi:importin-4-like [Bacillus rossius redtenbacheri]|uniref:importin-4-like n=1 Tax=Bacillus rossius redtenbacheri TaxID=93214 RepID=UPI002FDD2359
MEEILSKLLVADTAVIQQGTQELREAFKSPGVIPALCGVVGGSQNPQIRQYAAVLLRKRLSKARNWARLPENVRGDIKHGILQALVSEPEKSVKNAIAQFIGTVVRHEFPGQTWPEVLQFIQQMIGSNNPTHQELGMYTLSVITEVSADQFLPHAPQLVCALGATLGRLQSPACPLGYHALLTMVHLVPLLESDQKLVNLYHQLMPCAMDAVRAFARADEDKAVKVMELFDDLVENAVAVVVPHIKPLVEMSLQFAADKDLGDAIRVKALSFIGWITRTKKKAIVKHKLVQPIVDVLFQLESIPPANEDMEEYFIDDDDSNTPMTCATQTLDILALHLPPDKLFPPLLQHIEPSLQGNDVYKQKASYLTMAVLAEGCAEYIRTKYLKLFLQCVCKGIRDPTGVVRNAALFALGQFSEHLQPDISQFASELLPVLFDYLDQLCSQLQKSGKEPAGADRMFYALEMFCENLGDELLPYLPTLMERLFTALSPGNSVHLRELALSAIGATASAAKEGMIPYFPRVIEYLKMYLTQEQTEETMCLQVQAVDTLGVLARTIGAETFMPLSKESIQLGLNLINNTDDPDLRKSVYGLFGSIAIVLKEDMAAFLPVIVQFMLTSLRSSEGIVAHFREEDNGAYQVCEDLSDTPDEEDIENESEEEEDEDITGYSVENAYVDEKEEACLALKELAQHSGSAFLPYLQKCFEEVFKLITYPQDEIRKAVLETLLQFSICFSKIETEEGKAALSKALMLVVPKCAELIRMDEERSVVMTALDVYCDLLAEVKAPVLEGEGHTDAIINCIMDVMSYKTECQDKDDGESDDPDAEQDEVLIECAGNIVPNLGKAMSPDDFAMYFANLLPLFTAKSKKVCTVAQRSFSVGTLSECLQPLGPRSGQFVNQLLPLFLQASKDESDEVRNNAIFGIGELVCHGQEALHPHFPEILQALSSAAATETHPGALDNICGALSRMVISNVNGIPMEQVFPVFVNYLPLRQDFDENKSVYKCMLHLYHLGHPMLKKHLTPVLKTAFMVLHSHQGDTETLEMVLHFAKLVRRDFAEEFNKIVADLPQELTPVVQEVLSS